MMKIVGHSHHRQTLAHMANEDTLPSALLFAGVAGIGKMGVAQELARQLLCGSPSPVPQGGCGSCQTCTLVNVGNHPDLHTLSFREEQRITVDDVRHTLTALNLRSFMGGRRVAILNDADAMGVVSANILLKSLEEPRPDTYYILVASNPAQLPITVLSRCQKWFFDRLSTDDIAAILRARGEPLPKEEILALADGSITTLDLLKDADTRWEELQGLLESAYRGEAARVAQAAQKLGSEKDALPQTCILLRMALRKRLQESSGRDAAASAVWAHALQNLLDGEYLIFERHAQPTLVLFRVLEGCNAAYGARYMRTGNSHPTLLSELL
jgi:DNA polymerase III delta' subunit